LGPVIERYRVASDPETPAGYTVRAGTIEDAGALAELLNACTIGEAGMPWTDEAEMREDLAAPGFDPANDAVLVHRADGLPVAAVVLYPDGPPVTDVSALGMVHPEALGRGLGTFVTLLGEARARRKLPLAAPSGRVTVHASRFVQNEAAARLFSGLGYERVRTWWRMACELTDEIPTGPLPAGIEIRDFDSDLDGRAVYDALEEAFRDHWGEGMRSYEDWAWRVAGRAGSAPALVFVARDREEVAGVVVGRVGMGADPEAGSIDELGVRRPWRGRGLGLGLLHRAFAEFRRRGLARARLVVDSESPTGATRLYERAGMRVEVAWDRWEKELRPAAH
jgi:mycothiol synthase